MTRILFIFITLSTLLVLSCYTQDPPTNQEVIKEFYLSKASKVNAKVDELHRAVEQDLSTTQIQLIFKQARLAYKETEFLAEYYGGSIARFINGAPIPETDADDQHRTIMPEGFQVIEPLIFPQYDIRNRIELLDEIKRLKSNTNRLHLLAEVNPLVDEHIFDAIRLEIFRIITLGISGFDSAIAQHSIPEAKAAILSVQEVLKLYDGLKEKEPKLYEQNQKLFEGASNYLENHTNFNTFDRLHFVIAYLNPISANILKSWKTLGIPEMNDLRALRSDASTLFDKDAFNPDFFTPNSEAHSSNDKTKLGELLFFDPVLSVSMKRSCVTCHQPDKAFTDGVAKNFTINGDKVIKRNTPTIINSGLQASLFYDVRVAFLEDQATDVILNLEEMHGSLDLAVSRLRGSKEYEVLFKKAFPKDKEPVDNYNIRNALASFIRSQTSLNSRFDQYVRGDKKALSKAEINGFNVYMGKGKCGTCHFAPLFNGTVPPGYTKTESEVIGVPSTARSHSIDTDRGRFNNRKLQLQDNAFRTPTVRNIALTAPFMHNGIYKTLEEVIDFYNEGGGSGLGIELENQTLPFDKLNLTDQEKKDIIVFLKSLTDTSGINIPKSLPALSNKSRALTIGY